MNTVLSWAHDPLKSDFLERTMKTDLEVLISAEEIKSKLLEISKQLNEEYKGQEVTLVMVLKGAVCLVADLMRLLEFPVKLECVVASSYGTRGTERGDLHISGIQDLQVEGKHVLLVDDVFQTGNTLLRLVSDLKERRCKTVKSLVLLFKDIPRDISYEPDYFLFKIGDPFVVGYGMDYIELYRELPGIHIFR
jgi:hypoxanthine phosphoribosyltransferase